MLSGFELYPRWVPLFWAVFQTEMTAFPTVSYTSSSEMPTLSYFSSQKMVRGVADRNVVARTWWMEVTFFIFFHFEL